MASIYGAVSATGWRLRLDYTVSQDAAENRSTLALALYIYDGTGESYNQAANSCRYVLQGKTVYHPYRYEKKGWYQLGSGSVTVDHRADGSGSAAQHGPHAGDELHDAERLAQVVVRTVVQPLDDVDLAGFGRDHDDRRCGAGRVGAQLGQNLVAVLVGQHDVQNDEVGPPAAQRRPEAGRVLAARGLVPVGLQSVLLQLTDAGVVLDDVNHSKYPLL